MEGINIKDGLENMDFEKVTKMLSNAFWCKGIKINEIIKGAENSALVVGVFIDNVNQIGYSRIISDKTRFAYILDVYVDENFRKMELVRK